MNEFELSKNEQLDTFTAKDLNVNPTFPFEDNSFDVVTCVVSVRAPRAPPSHLSRKSGWSWRGNA